MLRINLSEKLNEGSSPEKEVELISMRSHFERIYIAFGRIQQNLNNEGIGITPTGFFTKFDGGFQGGWGEADPSEVFHLWGEIDEDEENSVRWILLHGEREYVFETSFPIEENGCGYPEIKDIHLFWNHIWKFVLDVRPRYESLPVGTHLNSGKIDKARDLEREYFSRFGQGHDDVLFE